MKRFFSLVILLLWLSLAKATVTMTITPSSAHLGDTVQLTLTLENANSQTLPDITPLEANFTIIGTQQSRSYSVINGKAHSRNQWIILLTPKKQGLLTIPPLQIGNEVSNVVQLLVKKNPTTTTNNEDHDILFSGTISKSDPFIHEQVVYTVKLYTTQRLLDIEYQPPEIDDALLIPLGEGRRYHETIQDREYAVDEQQYAIFPQKSGLLHLSPPTLNALVYDVVPRRIQKQAKPIQLNVKPQTEKYGFPAKQVTLSEHYQIPTTTLTTGDTIVRSITLEALGVPAQLLPTIAIENSSQYRAYPEKPTTNNILRQQELVGTSTINITYVLNQAGTVTLAPIKLTWFNTQTRQREIARLPEYTLTVHAKNTTLQTPKPVQSITKATKQAETNRSASSAAWWLATILGCGWIITLILWWFYRNNRLNFDTNNRSVLHAIQVACQSNDPIQTQTALLLWASKQWPQVSCLNLNDIIKLVADNSLLQKQIQGLSHALYSQQTQSTWHGENLWNSIQSYKPQKKQTQKKKQTLASIHPHR